MKFGDKTITGKGQELYRRAKELIPGGTQLLSKRPDMFLPEYWPSYYSKAKGSEVWDLDNNKYVDMSFNGIGACVLGHADPDVNDAVHKAIDSGSMSTLNCPEEVELAEILCSLHPWSDKVRFARSGGEAMSVAVRIARAYTGKDKVAFSGYHGWHDWYLSANLADDDALDGHLIPGLEPNGVPRALKNSSFPFHYNRLDELEQIIKSNPDQIAAIIMEPIRSEEPANDFLQNVRLMADRIGAVLIFDEITIGFRLNPGGIHLLYSVNPDVAVFGKAIGNGYPMSAIIGSNDVMEAAQNSFVSSTYWTERIGPVSAIATITKFQKENVHTHLSEVGEKVQDVWRNASAHSEINIDISGVAPLSHFDFNHENKLAIKTLFTQLMLEKGFLATNSFYATFSHSFSQIDEYSAAVSDVFNELAKSLHSDSVEARLWGPVAHSGFERLT